MGVCRSACAATGAPSAAVFCLSLLTRGLERVAVAVLLRPAVRAGLAEVGALAIAVGSVLLQDFLIGVRFNFVAWLAFFTGVLPIGDDLLNVDVP